MKKSTFKPEVRSQRGFEIIFMLLLHLHVVFYIYKVVGAHLSAK